MNHDWETTSIEYDFSAHRCKNCDLRMNTRSGSPPSTPEECAHAAVIDCRGPLGLTELYVDQKRVDAADLDSVRQLVQTWTTVPARLLLKVIQVTAAREIALAGRLDGIGLRIEAIDKLNVELDKRLGELPAFVEGEREKATLAERTRIKAELKKTATDYGGEDERHRAARFALIHFAENLG